MLLAKHFGARIRENDVSSFITHSILFISKYVTNNLALKFISRMYLIVIFILYAIIIGNKKFECVRFSFEIYIIHSMYEYTYV